MDSYTAIIWDWNGTLLDDVQLSLDIVNEMLAEQGLAALTVQRCKDIFDIPASLYWERAGMDLQTIPFEAVSLAFCARFEQRVHTAALFPGVRHVLHTLQQHGIAQFLLSSTEHQALMRMLTAFQLQEAFDGIHGTMNTLALGKLGGGRVLLDAYDLERRRTVFIGDTTHDAEVA
jgi:phosphoglycolate phosphatase